MEGGFCKRITPNCHGDVHRIEVVPASQLHATEVERDAARAELEEANRKLELSADAIEAMLRWGKRPRSDASNDLLERDLRSILAALSQEGTS